MRIKYPLLILLFFINNHIFSQNTIGLLSNTEAAYDGYTLFTPELNNSVFLIDNCGKSINTWTFNGTPKLTCYLLENGNLLRTGSSGIEIRDWDNNLIWEHNLQTSSGIRQHHDIEPLPNGNILCLVKDFISEEEQISLGKNPTLLNGTFKSEKVIEIEPIGTNDINIVWEWRFVDHLIQDFDATKSNYGDVVSHPELVDFNYDETGFNHSDWLHMNSIDYNPELDQIILSARTLGEIFIIDHSTSTTEASGHFGGNQNKGGDFLWRWGNPQVYRQGTSSDQKLTQQHDAKWIRNNYVNEQKITVFNNNSDGTGTFSSIHIISPTLDENNAYVLQDEAFLPTDYFWSWSGDILGETLYQFNKSGVHGLENGNMLLCETKKGRLTEISPAGDIVWVYRNPVGSITHNQFETDAEITNDNSMFRGEKYHKTYAAFMGRDLTPGDILEDVNSTSENCNSLFVQEFDIEKQKISFNNPIVNKKIIFHQELENTDISIYNTLGKVNFETKAFSGKHLELANFKPGIYFVEIKKSGKVLIEKALVR